MIAREIALDDTEIEPTVPHVPDAPATLALGVAYRLAYVHPSLGPVFVAPVPYVDKRSGKVQSVMPTGRVHWLSREETR
jgi:hypothetical protein